ncbi:MAG TPA: hypothetical protein VNO33_08195 [Kofleriaceae bacterium]|nr:hypothetical protein [Kofleriaceae bacterium]
MRASAKRWIIAALASAALALTAGAASAGRSHFGWLRATEVLPERGVEMETWLFEKNGVGDAEESETILWWMTVVGITDQLELAVPVELRHRAAGDETLLYGFGAELRWRLVSPDPVEAGPFAPAVRLGVHRLISARDRVRGEAGAGLGVDLGSRVHLATDVGATWTVGEDDSAAELQPAAGVSVRLVDQLRAGAEVYAEIVLDGDGVDWIAAGPNLAWTHGRFWISAALGIGIIDIEVAPRVNWAVAF